MMYNKNVYHLDLCILAYQLHAQSLMFPFDPFFEDSDADNNHGSRKANRNKFMVKAATTVDNSNNLPGGLRGPGKLVGLVTNKALDQVLSDYNRINPWEPGFTRQNGTKEELIVYHAPQEITDKIGQVAVARYANAVAPAPFPTVAEFMPQPPPANGHFLMNRPGYTVGDSAVPDKLYCFEGGTGNRPHSKLAYKRVPNYSLMGFCLARTTTNGNYDVHITFRGSRSGTRRMIKAGIGHSSPDWVTDMGYTNLTKVPEIGGDYRITDGFAQSMKTMLPTIYKCLEQIHTDRNPGRNPGAPKTPENIYVTGHSLGGALAVMFVSAVLFGTLGKNSAIPNPPAAPSPMQITNNVRTWRWDTNLHLLTYSAPIVGAKKLRHAFKDAFNAPTQTGEARRFWMEGDVVPLIIVRQGKDRTISPPFQQSYSYKHVGKSTRIRFKSPTFIRFLNHSPHMVRNGLLKLIANSNGALGDLATPAITPANHLTIPLGPNLDRVLPWREFKTISEAFAHMVTCGTTTTPYLPNMTESLDLYLEILDQERRAPYTAPACVSPPQLNALANGIGNNAQNDVIRGQLRNMDLDDRQSEVCILALLMCYVAGKQQNYTAVFGQNANVPKLFERVIAMEHG